MSATRISRPFRALVRRLLLTSRKGWVAARCRLRRRPGIADEPNGAPVISLTSIPSRLDGIHLCLESLLGQSLRPARIVLWLAEGVALPAVAERLTAFGVEVRRGEDLGPHTKLLHSLAAFPDEAVVTADDDVLYPRHWLHGLVRGAREHPKDIHFYRGRLIRFAADGRLTPMAEWDFLASKPPLGPDLRLFPTGVGGVLYPPRCLHPEVFNRSAFGELCPTNDDIWFKAMALHNGRSAHKVAGGFDTLRFHSLATGRRNALWSVNREANDDQVRRTFAAYDLHEVLRRATT